MDILDDMGVSKLSANVFSKVNYSCITVYCVTWKTHFLTIQVCVHTGHYY